MVRSNYSLGRDRLIDTLFFSLQKSKILVSLFKVGGLKRPTGESGRRSFKKYFWAVLMILDGGRSESRRSTRSTSRESDADRDRARPDSRIWHS